MEKKPHTSRLDRIARMKPEELKALPNEWKNTIDRLNALQFLPVPGDGAGLVDSMPTNQSRNHWISSKSLTSQESEALIISAEKRLGVAISRVLAAGSKEEKYSLVINGDDAIKKAKNAGIVLNGKSSSRGR